MLSSGSDSVPVSIIEYPEGTCEREEPAHDLVRAPSEKGVFGQAERLAHGSDQCELIDDLPNCPVFTSVGVGRLRQRGSQRLLLRVRPLTKVIMGRASDPFKSRAIDISSPCEQDDRLMYVAPRLPCSYGASKVSVSVLWRLFGPAEMSIEGERSQPF
jgi:hypothetical protein